MITYRAHTNIALIKYWGKRNAAKALPMTSSLSLTLDAFYTDTRVKLCQKATEDQFKLNGQLQDQKETQKISRFVDLFRKLAETDQAVIIDSTNFVPTGAGLASSASAFAALACCLNDLFQLNLSMQDLSILTRQGSGSACRSLFGGFVLWHRGQDDDMASSFAEQIDPAEFDIGMLTIVINRRKKKISSRQGMAHTVNTSPFYALWPQEVERDLERMLDAIKAQDVDAIGSIAEHNAMKMHATVLASNPSFTYFEPTTLTAINAVKQLRLAGYSCYYTIDAGPNVKVIAPYSQLSAIQRELANLFEIDQLVVSKVGSNPKLLTKE